MKKDVAKKSLNKTNKQKDMSVSELSKLMLKGFSDVDSKFKDFDRKMVKGFKDADMKNEELAGMVARGFTETQETLRGEMHEMEERLDERIDGVDGRLTVLNQKVDRIQDSVNDLSYEKRKTHTRVENLELKVFGSIQEA